MALFVRQNEDRSELQQRLATELQERAKKKAQQASDLPDGVEDSNYLKDTKKTTSLAGVWVVIILLAIAALVFLLVQATS